MSQQIYSALLIIPALMLTGSQWHLQTRETERARYRQVLKESPAGVTQVAAREALARRQAQAAVALLRLGDAELVWPLFRHRPDPGLRSYLIHDLGSSGAAPEIIIRRLKVEGDVSARRALLLSLGGFTDDQLPASQRQSLIEQFLKWYRNDPDPGIHSAIDWLLRYGRQGEAARALDWQQREALSATDRDLAGRPAGRRNWYLTKEGQTMAIVRGPVEFTMGSPDYEPGRKRDESPHRVTIPRSFAIATKEMTVAQFQRFLEANPKIREMAQAAGDKDPSHGGRKMREFSPDDDGPQILMTWYEAAQYCNWLSQQEGIPESEWCYPALDDIKAGMRLPNDYLRRTGYRLPTEAEWEFASRAGATTARFYGTSEDLLKEYAWYSRHPPKQKNEAVDPGDPARTWPVGQLKPNDLGLFDVYGNVWEWGQDLWVDYASLVSQTVEGDTEGAALTVTDNGTPRPRRGGSFSYEADFMRSAHRGTTGGYNPNERRDTVGFRVARTYR